LSLAILNLDTLCRTAWLAQSVVLKLDWFASLTGTTVTRGCTTAPVIPHAPFTIYGAIKLIADLQVL